MILIISAIMLFCCCERNGLDSEPKGNETKDTTESSRPDPTARKLYNGIELPSVWPPYSSYSGSILTGMSPSYLQIKPDTIDISIGRQLFVDDFLIESTTLDRKWYQATYYEGNPVFSPTTAWEMMNNKGGGFAAPFSDGVWFDETENKFKMWYLGGGALHGDGNFVTCYAESTDGINWNRPSLRLVDGTNIVHKGKNRDSNTIWIDKTETNLSKRFKMFNVYGGAGNWKYHYFTSPDGKMWREEKESGALADRSTVFHNPFRGVWVYSMRHNVRVDTDNLIRARDYYENADPLKGTENAKADLQRFWFGPWPNEPKHDKYTNVQPAIYNFDAIAYESIMLGQFSVWSGPENDVCSKDNVIKRNQILLGFSRDGWSWYREDFLPFCPVNQNSSSWNNGNIQTAVGSPIIVGDKLYFYMSGRKLNSNNAEVTSTGLAFLRRDGFASMSGTGELITETFKFSGEYLFINANVKGNLHVEILDADGKTLSGYTKNECIEFTGDNTKKNIRWINYDNLSRLKGKNIRIKFYMESGDIYSFWISKTIDGKSQGYTGGGGYGYSKYGIDL